MSPALLGVIGSSPLARGLRSVRLLGGSVGRIIPARAGFTPVGHGSKPLSGDHPRSRGVYSFVPSELLTLSGSSPLARGLPSGRPHTIRLRRIIPARAGFTCRRSPAAPRRPDHPRSRGVYLPCIQLKNNMRGSSPLARGLLGQQCGRGGGYGIIPARAGFTRPPPIIQQIIQDHPRSRGVYRFRRNDRCPATGSSPLARGLRVATVVPFVQSGIIPARAGFTV